jgi:hypothetical protein
MAVSSGGRLVLASACLACIVLAASWIRGAPPQPVVQASAQTPSSPAPPPSAPNASTDNGNRWVAVINGNIPITREEFGEYLIARHSDQLELLVNKKIIENACKQRGIEVSQAEVDAALAEDLKGLKVNLDLFVNKLLKQYHKSLYEWKEDVIKPKLALTKLCRGRVQISDQDYQAAFQAYYGEKVDCRIILWPKGEEKHAMNAYADLRKSDADFDRIARQQASPTLAATGGQIQPFGRHTTGNDELEKEAFNLQPGEISRLIGTPDGTVVLKCIRRIPADANKKIENERAALEKEIVEKKTQLELPKVFKELQDQAQPKLFLKKYTTEEELVRDVTRELQSGQHKEGKKPN